LTWSLYGIFPSSLSTCQSPTATVQFWKVGANKPLNLERHPKFRWSNACVNMGRWRRGIPWKIMVNRGLNQKVLGRCGRLKPRANARRMSRFESGNCRRCWVPIRFATEGLTPMYQEIHAMYCCFGDHS